MLQRHLAHKLRMLVEYKHNMLRVQQCGVGSCLHVPSEFKETGCAIPRRWDVTQKCLGGVKGKRKREKRRAHEEKSTRRTSGMPPLKSCKQKTHGCESGNKRLLIKYWERRTRQSACTVWDCQSAFSISDNADHLVRFFWRSHDPTKHEAKALPTLHSRLTFG